jgi:hypothetical protein
MVWIAQMVTVLCLQNRIELVDIRSYRYYGIWHCSANSKLAELESGNKKSGGSSPV